MITEQQSSRLLPDDQYNNNKLENNNDGDDYLIISLNCRTKSQRNKLLFSFTRDDKKILRPNMNKKHKQKSKCLDEEKQCYNNHLLYCLLISLFLPIIQFSEATTSSSTKGKSS